MTYFVLVACRAAAAPEAASLHFSFVTAKRPASTPRSSSQQVSCLLQGPTPEKNSGVFHCLMSWRARVAEETDKWGKVVKFAGMKAD
jgi:hypothetical protein